MAVSGGSALPPLRGSDSPDSFTFVSIHTRLVAILRQAAAPNAEVAATIEGFAAMIQQAGGRIPALPALGSTPSLSVDALSTFADWECLAQARNDAGESFDDAPWFWVENFAFHFVNRVVGSAVGFTPRGAPCADPFAAQKRASLDACADAFPATILPLLSRCGKGSAEGVPALRAALLRSLWGNRHDLSLSGGVVGGKGAGAAWSGLSDTDCLLADDSPTAAAMLHELALRADGTSATVSLLLDNCGLELLSDLALALLLVRRGVRVRLICKVRA